MNERVFDPISGYETAEPELTLEQRYELASQKIIEVYSQCLADGRYDMAWNKLSPHLYHLRSLHYERLYQDQEPEPKPVLSEITRLYSE